MPWNANRSYQHGKRGHQRRIGTPSPKAIMTGAILPRTYE